MSGKKYFYALGQRVRSMNLPKSVGESLYKLSSGPDYARIAFDAGFRGLAF
jgi:hypothetical protein